MTDDNGRYSLRVPSGGVQLYFNSLPEGFVYPDPQVFKKLDVKAGQAAVDVGDVTLKRKGQTVAKTSDGGDAKSDTARKSVPVDPASVRSTVQTWLDDAFQIDSAIRREAAIEKVRGALESGEDSDIRKGLAAFTAMSEIRFDKASFHDLIVPLLTSTAGDIRAQAAQALVITGVLEGDLGRFVELAGDSDAQVREKIAYVIVTAVQQDVTSSPAKDAILKLLNDSEEPVRKGAIHSMWGVKLSPEASKGPVGGVVGRIAPGARP